MIFSSFLWLSLLSADTSSFLEVFQTVPGIKNWAAQCSSPSPLKALNKTYAQDYQLTDENLELILKGKTLLRFPRPLIKNSEPREDFDIFLTGDARRFNAQDIEDAPESETKFEFILKSALDLIVRREKDELLIISQSALHALDIYFAPFLRDEDKKKRDPILQRRNEILYMGMPINPESSFLSTDYYELRRGLDGIATPTRRFKDVELDLSVAYYSRLHYFNQLKKGFFNLALLKEEKLSSSFGVIVLMDQKYLQESACHQALPSGDDLKKWGFKKVRLAVEGLKFGKSYSIDDFERASKTPFFPPLKSFEIDYLKRKNPALEKKFRDGMTMDKPPLVLSQRLRAAAQTGLEIHITGLEETERLLFPSSYEAAPPAVDKSTP